MATSKSTSTIKSNGKKDVTESKKNADLFGLKTGFTPLFDSAHEIKEDFDGVPIKGTGLLFYQGFTNSIIEWVDEKSQDEKVVEAYKHVFAVKANDGSWKCIDITMTKWNKGNAYDRFLKRMGITDILVEVDDPDQIPGFTKNWVPNESIIREGLEKMRGMSFKAVLERSIKKNGAKIYDILIDSIEFLTVNDEHYRVLPIEKTDPRAKTIYSLNSAE